MEQIVSFWNIFITNLEERKGDEEFYGTTDEEDTYASTAITTQTKESDEESGEEEVSARPMQDIDVDGLSS